MFIFNFKGDEIQTSTGLYSDFSLNDRKFLACQKRSIVQKKIACSIYGI